MATAYVCDDCGELFKGKPRDVVGGHDNANTWLRVMVHQRGEGTVPTPELCYDCRMAAILAVLRDLKVKL